MNTNLLTTRWQDLPEKALRRLQAEKLRRYLRCCVVPFSVRYREMFNARGLTDDSFRSLEDLQRLPFTSKTDLLDTPGSSERLKDFLLIPDQKTQIGRASCRERV